jgi:hypothetical protein
VEKELTRQILPLQRHRSVHTDAGSLGNGSPRSPHTGHEAQWQLSVCLRDRNSSAMRFVVEKRANFHDCTAERVHVVQYRSNTREGASAALPNAWNTRWRRPVAVAGCWDLTCDHLVRDSRNNSPAQTNLERGTIQFTMQIASRMVPLAAHTLDTKRSGNYRCA